MTAHLLSHLRSNAIAYLALFVALGGTSYAAITLPPGSVGARQLRNSAVTTRKLADGSVTRVKLGKGIAGSVRSWAVVSASGTVEASSRKTRIIGAPGQGGYLISWGITFSDHCAAIATPTGSSLVLGPPPGYASTRIAGAHPTLVTVDTYNTQGQPTPAAFSLVVIC